MFVQSASLAYFIAACMIGANDADADDFKSATTQKGAEPMA